MPTKLSPVQEQCLAAAKQHGGTLVYYKGGFWSATNVVMKPCADFMAPEWHFGTVVIRALIRKEYLEVVEEKEGRKGPYPVKVRVL